MSVLAVIALSLAAVATVSPVHVFLTWWKRKRDQVSATSTLD
jgi:hypothetical protein